jgi:SNF family Na+-dependent transporter
VKLKLLQSHKITVINKQFQNVKNCNSENFCYFTVEQLLPSLPALSKLLTVTFFLLLIFKCNVAWISNTEQKVLVKTFRAKKKLMKWTIWEYMTNTLPGWFKIPYILESNPRPNLICTQFLPPS